jgi:flagellar biosynthesis protein FlhG
VKRLDELDHYELLEVPRDARSDEIARAYELVRAAYAGDSLAAYSVFEDDEAGALRERIERAYRVLSDPAARSAYDATRSEPGAGEASLARPRVAERELEGLAESDPVAILEAPLARPATPELRGFEEFEERDDAEWDGARLRRVRLLRGVELDALAAITKINPTYLRFLEEERFDDLPAAVYVRGFIIAYARQLGLDASLVARSYTARLEEHRSTRPRGHQLGRW